MDEFIARCQELAGDEWEYFSEWYSFKTAYKQGMTPEEAIEDCRKWIYA